MYMEIFDDVNNLNKTPHLVKLREVAKQSLKGQVFISAVGEVKGEPESADQKKFWLMIRGNEEVQGHQGKTIASESKFQGLSEAKGRLVKLVFDGTKPKEQMITIDENEAIVLNKIAVISIEQYAEDRLMLGLNDEKDNLIDLDLQDLDDIKMHHIELPSINNPLITSIQPFGKQGTLDLKNFPYLVAKGYNAAVLVNVDTRKAQVLMTEVPICGGMKNCLQFLDEVKDFDEHGNPKQPFVSCVYATQMLGFQSSKVFQLHKMTFFNDFLKLIAKHGQILDVQLETVKELEGEVERLESQNKTIDDLLKII